MRAAFTHVCKYTCQGQEEASKYLEDNFLVYCKLGNDVRQKQVPAVLARWVHTGLGEQAGPGKGHEAAQLAVAVLIVVMDVVGGVLHQQRGTLQQVDPQCVQHVCLLLWVEDLWEQPVERSSLLGLSCVPTLGHTSSNLNNTNTHTT